MWDGMFMPFDLYKDRDNAHGSILAHLEEQGGGYEIGERVMCHTDPITGKPLQYDRPYFIVNVSMPVAGGMREYPYLVPAMVWNSPPTKRQIERALIEYAKHPGERPRHIQDYIENLP